MFIYPLPCILEAVCIPWEGGRGHIAIIDVTALVFMGGSFREENNSSVSSAV